MVMENKLGLVHVYTGDGKGKTSAAMGLALRAIGQGLKVFIIQFMKGGAYTGEYISAKNFLPNNEFIQYGRSCVKEDKDLRSIGFADEERKKVPPFFDKIREDIECGPCRYCFLNDEEQKRFVKMAFEKAKEVASSGAFDLVVLDEINVAVKLNFINVDELINLIKTKSKNTELIITGRDAHPQVIELADLVTEMKLIKHYYNKGVAARRGIEY
jgi:cob(I)alamin adenosyltransferase